MDNITQKSNFKNFINYTIPAISSMLLAGVYTLVDGLFVGWGVGPSGLAAINVAFPIACLYLGIGEMLGNGSAIVIAYCRGRQLSRTAGLFFGNLLAIVIPLGIFLAVISPFSSHLVNIIGADESIRESAYNYALIIGFGSIFQLLASSLLAVMRHDQVQVKAMRIMLWGLIANIILDYLFVIVFRWGVNGSAWATIMAQGLTAFLACWHFLKNGVHFKFKAIHLRPYLDIIAKIIFTGLPSMGLQLTNALVIALHNVQALRYGGENAVAGYAIVSYVLTPVLLLQEGTAIGIQPLISFFDGANLQDRKRKIFRMGLTSGILIGLVAMIGAVIFNQLLPAAFHATSQVAKLAAKGILFGCLAFPIQGIIQIAGAYFQASNRPKYASLLIYGDCCGALVLCLFTFPLIWGLDGVWSSMVGAKLIMFIITLYLLKSKRR